MGRPVQEGTVESCVNTPDAPVALRLDRKSEDMEADRLQDVLGRKLRELMLF